MALIDLMREALRFLPPKKHHFLTIEGTDGRVRLVSSDFRRLYQNWNTYGQPDLPDENQAFNHATAEMKRANGETKGLRKTNRSYKPPYEDFPAAGGPICALHVEAKDEFVAIEDGKHINLIEGKFTLAITDKLRKAIGSKSAKAFVIADETTNSIEQLEICKGNKVYLTEPFNAHPLIPLHLTGVRKVAERWSRAQCAVNLVLIKASDSTSKWAVRGGDVEKHWYGDDIKHLLTSVNDAFLELDEQGTVIFYDMLENNRVRLYWETALACYSWVMRLHEP